MPARLPSLTGLRFWAALLVVLYHLSRQVGTVPLISPLAWYGRSGVTFFFVLSGFVLAWTYSDSPVPAGRFYRRRLARIWPLHALTTAASLTVYAAIGAPVPLAAGLWSLLLVHPWTHATTMGGNPAGWSLGDEAWFYLLFPALSLGRLRRWAAFCLAAGPLLWLAGAWIADPYERSWVLDYLPLTRTPQFLLGVVLALAVRRGRLPRVPLGPAVLAVAGWQAVLVPWHRAVADGLWYGPYCAAQLLSAPLFGALIVAAAQRDLVPRQVTLAPSRRAVPDAVLGGGGPLAGRVWVRLGEWSFAWYLVHEIVFRCWLHVFGPPAPGARTALVWLLLLSTTLALAAALHRWVERPLERLLRGEGGTTLPPGPRGRLGRQRSLTDRHSSVEPSRLA